MILIFDSKMCNLGIYGFLIARIKKPLKKFFEKNLNNNEKKTFVIVESKNFKIFIVKKYNLEFLAIYYSLFY